MLIPVCESQLPLHVLYNKCRGSHVMHSLQLWIPLGDKLLKHLAGMVMKALEMPAFTLHSHACSVMFCNVLYVRQTGGDATKL